MKGDRCFTMCLCNSLELFLEVSCGDMNRHRSSSCPLYLLLDGEPRTPGGLWSTCA